MITTTFSTDAITLIIFILGMLLTDYSFNSSMDIGGYQQDVESNVE